MRESAFSVKNSSLNEIKRTDVLLMEYFFGHENSLSKEELDFLRKFKEISYKSNNWNFLDKSSQYCYHAFMSINYQGKNLTWEELPIDEKHEDFNEAATGDLIAEFLL